MVCIPLLRSVLRSPILRSPSSHSGDHSTIVTCSRAVAGLVVVVAAVSVTLQAQRAPGALGLAAELTDAVKTNDAERVAALLTDGVPPRGAEGDGTTPLHWASRVDSLPIARLLIDRGVDVDAANRYGVTPLTLAATNGSELMTAALLDAGADPNLTTPGGDTPLMLASRTGRVGVVTRLLEAGADPNVTESWRGQTALMWSAAENNVEAIEALVAAGANVDAASAGLMRPLHFAVRDGHIDAVRTLAAAGADIDTPLNNTSLLALAVINAHFELAAVLVDLGADPNVEDRRGSVLHALAWMRRPGSGRPPIPTGTIDSLDLARKLLARRADPDVRIAWAEIPFEVDLGITRPPPNISVGRSFLSFVGATPFYLAAKHADMDYMRVLVAHGADPIAATDQGVTPLMAAAGVGFWDGESPGPLNGTPDTVRLEAVKLALALGNDLHASTDFGTTRLEGDGSDLRLRHPVNLPEFDVQRDRGDMRWGESTALHGAAMIGANLIVEFLVEQGADVDAQNSLGWTPRMVAEGVFVANTLKAWPETVQLLEQLERDASE